MTVKPEKADKQALFALGFLSIGTQIYLVRESMMVFEENELVIGLVLATWMLLTGAGSYMGRYSRAIMKGKGIRILLLLAAGIMPSLMVAGTDMLKSVMVPYGSMAGPWQVMLICVAVQFPFSLLNGFLFSSLSTDSPESSPAAAYSWESLGSMASGALVNFLFLWFLGPFRGLTILTGVYLALVTSYVKAMSGKRPAWAVAGVSVIFLALTGFSDPREFSERILYPSQQVVSDRETPYGQVVITRTGEQFNYYENGTLLFSSGNEIGNEENVHYAMAQHPRPANVLLISGGFSGTLSEILKYKPARLDYVELDPSLIGIASAFTRQLDDPAVRLHETDARRFIRKTDGRYDVVLVNLPPPSTLQLNRYYTLDFLRETREKMRPGAVIAYSLPTGADYVSEQAGLLNGTLWHTLKQSFRNVLVVPAGRNYFLASDSALSLNIPALVEARGIETAYVNRYYIDPARLKELSDRITPSGSTTPSGWDTLTGWVNRDFSPVAVWHQQSWWLSHFRVPLAFVICGFIAVLLLLAVTLNPVSAGLFTGGFTLASAEIILIFGVQVLCGYVFQAVGAVIMIFMLGLAAGSGIARRSGKMKPAGIYMRLQFVLAILALAIPFVIRYLGVFHAGTWTINAVTGISGFVLAGIVGMEYRIAASLSDKPLQKTVAGNYSADMFGSAAGAFAVTLFLIPGIGMTGTGLFLAAINLVSALVLIRARRKG